MKSGNSNPPRSRSLGTVVVVEPSVKPTIYCQKRKKEKTKDGDEMLNGEELTKLRWIIVKILPN